MASLKNILKAGFPFLSAGLGVAGPIGQLAANALGQALGVNKTNPSVDDIQKALAAGLTPDQITALKQAEQQFQLQMQQMNLQHESDLESLAEKDRESARQRQIQVKDKIPAFLAIAITLGFFGLLGSLLKWSPPVQNKDILNLLLGSLGTAWIAVVTYYFGSSAGSAKKDETISSLHK